MRVSIKRIMCATDFSESSDHALSYGIALAKEFNAKLYVCHVVDLTSAGIYGEAFLAFEDQQNRIQKRALEDLKTLLEKQAVDWEPVVTSGRASDEVTRMAQEKGVDLVVSATHGRSGLKRVIIGSVTERLMRTLPCPLMVVRGREEDFMDPGRQEIRMKRVLVGCDFSPDSDLAFQYGLSLAQEFQSELHLVHVIETPAYKDLLKLTAEVREELKQDLRSTLHGKLTDMVPQEALAWCTPKTTLLAGQPHEEILKYAVVNDADLIVLGVRGRGQVETLLVGSTTDRVARSAPCPVLSVRPLGTGEAET